MWYLGLQTSCQTPYIKQTRTTFTALIVNCERMHVCLCTCGIPIICGLIQALTIVMIMLPWWLGGGNGVFVCLCVCVHGDDSKAFCQMAGCCCKWEALFWRPAKVLNFIKDKILQCLIQVFNLLKLCYKD